MELWTDSHIFHTGNDYFHSLRRDISKAQKSITLESYIFALDALTQTLLKDLADARQRGCTVKIILDGFGSYEYIPAIDRICEKAGIELRVFHPFPYPLLVFQKLSFLREDRTQNIFRHMNRRNHRKTVIIDEKIAYLGSLNFTQVHCADFVGDKAWRDTGVRLEGTPVRQLLMAFQVTYLRTYYRGMLSWMNSWRWPQPHGSPALLLNTTKKMRKGLYRDVLRKLNSAEKRIYITTAYFLPKRNLLRILLKAARRGVDVRILIPGKSDVPLVKWAAFYIVRFLLKRRIPLYEYQKSILHAKTMIIDEDVYIGSFNLNHRSIFHDLEVIACLRNPERLAEMLVQWEKDIENSKPVSVKDFRAPSWFARMMYWVAFRLRYML
jgi:cardiolipin synthase